MQTLKHALTTLLATSIALASWSARAADPVEKPKARPTVAILYMDYTGKDDNLVVLKKGLAQMLISDLSTVPTVQIVERDRLQDIMDELQLGTSAKIDPATANRLGKLLGAKYMVLGGFFDLLGTLRVDARVVEVETGKVIRSVGAQGKEDAFLDIEQKIVTELEAIFTSADIEAPPAPKTTTPRQTVARPKAVKTKTVARYGKALDFMDKGDTVKAKEELQQVVAEQPDFQLAANDLARLMQ